jgi:hypothetical protein
MIKHFAEKESLIYLDKSPTEKEDVDTGEGKDKDETITQTENDPQQKW